MKETMEQILAEIEAENNKIKSSREAILYNISNDTINSLLKTVKSIGEATDIEKINNRIDAAMNHEYGTAFGLINLIANILYWPGGNTSEMADKRAKLVEDFKLPVKELMDLRKYRGYHSWYNQDVNEIYEGIEPNIDKVIMLLTTIATGLVGNTAYTDATIDLAVWRKNEEAMKKKAKVDRVRHLEALELHKQMTGMVEEKEEEKEEAA